MALYTFLNEIPDENAAINWAQVNGLINFDPLCSKCRSEMKEMVQKYRCRKSSCQAITPLKSGTIFDHSMLSIRTLVLLMYFWACKMTIGRVSFGCAVIPSVGLVQQIQRICLLFLLLSN